MTVLAKLELWAELWRRARAEELGLVITTNNPRRTHLYLDETRQALAESNPWMYDFTVCIPSTPETVYITRKTVEIRDDFEALRT